MRFFTILAPTTSWWWKETRPSFSKRRVRGLPMSWRSAASRRVRSGPSLLQVDRLLQDGQAVLVDVLVTVMLVTLQPQRRKLRQHVRGEAGVDEQGEALARVGGEQELVELVADPLRGDDGDPLGHRRHGGDHLGRHVEVELRGEPGGAHHPQRVVGEGCLGRPGRPQHLGRQVLQAAVRVDEGLLRQGHRHGVDREVAADQVVLDRVAVGDLGLARGAVVRLRAVRGDLDLEGDLLALDHGPLLAADGAEGDADLPDGVRPRPDQPEDLLRPGVGGEVQVVPQPPEQRVADRAAHQREGVSGLLETAGKIVRGGGDAQQFAHSAALRLAQFTGLVFVGVRHNRKGYVPASARADPIPGGRPREDPLEHSPALRLSSPRYDALDASPDNHRPS
ncbi:hypothetical protein M2168_003161 [Streptomyces sp. CZ24]|nr:hypothetical protein [Streptomyces sp. CZ24]